MVVAGFAVDDVLVVVVAAGFGAVAYAAQTLEEEKLRRGIRYANGATREDGAEKRAETPLRAAIVGMVDV